MELLRSRCGAYSFGWGLSRGAYTRRTGSFYVGVGGALLRRLLCPQSLVFGSIELPSCLQPVTKTPDGLSRYRTPAGRTSVWMGPK